ncbi:MAG: hypothetical protein WA919_10950 [Coleofasciculaceae cyanobacterium]
MRKFKDWMLVPTALVMLLASSGVVRSETIAISRLQQEDPIVFSGTSGGAENSNDCGMIATTPNHVIQIDEQIDYLQFTVEGGGQPTLLIEGPNSRTCVPGLPDEHKVEDSGLWKPGQYSISVGEAAGGQYPYTLSITSER